MYVHEIESLRKQLVKKVIHCKKLTDDQVVQLSQQLDTLIVEDQRWKAKKRVR
ncbi:aspartyl-phosphate phosphatase Spo0E family protein [Longirhabdus pacifica]|uniref:aspartyl-phosphate phosphatase Spo0E family protein n=1 Tax=Longirhabdus pacifica TaxID=2305227 RepID=UPI0013E89F85|nr:aspartyl-phosphate phosphatase Spo0E family protein [Longirhabdus pacifica]